MAVALRWASSQNLMASSGGLAAVEAAETATAAAAVEAMKAVETAVCGSDSGEEDMDTSGYDAYDTEGDRDWQGGWGWVRALGVGCGAGGREGGVAMHRPCGGLWGL